MTEPRHFSITARLASFANALRGLKEMIQSHHNAWVHAAATGVVCTAAIACRLPGIEWCAIVLSIVVVWTAEGLNTALELLTDVASPEFHPLAGKAKDVAAGSVLIAAIGAFIVGGIIFIPHILALMVWR